MKRRRVQSRLATLRRDGGHLVSVDTPATLAAAVTPAQVLARAGALGEDVAPLLAAADAFEALAIEAGLRGRLARSALSRSAGGDAPSTAARVELARLSEALGADAFGVLLDACVWHSPLPPPRWPLFRAALHAVAAWQRRRDDRPRSGQQKTPTDA